MWRQHCIMSKVEAFNQIGGRASLITINKVFYDKVYQHPWLKQYFLNVPQQYIEDQQVDFMQKVLGGENCYIGKARPVAHKHMFIPDELFDVRKKLLIETFNETNTHPRLMESAIREAILILGSVSDFPVVNFAPQAVYLWLYPSASCDDVLTPDMDESELAKENEEIESEKKAVKKSTSARKKAERVDSPDSRGGMMIFRLESLFSWSEFSKMDRGTDDSDEDDEDYQSTIDDLDKITLTKKQEHQKSGQIKIDLDLPSASEDDIPLGEGIKLPEWNYKTQTLAQERCLLQPMLPKNSVPAKLPARLQKTSRMIQAQFEGLRCVKYWLKAQPQGEELDLNAWLDFHVESKTAATAEKGLCQSYIPITLQDAEFNT